MQLDIRLPMGAMFTILGLILVIYGVISGTLVMDINVNLWWGLVMLVFGLFLLVLARGSFARTPEV
jgi:hypothetical protein